jgi:hypothetical protein
MSRAVRSAASMARSATDCEKQILFGFSITSAQFLRGDFSWHKASLSGRANSKTWLRSNAQMAEKDAANARRLGVLRTSSELFRNPMPIQFGDSPQTATDISRGSIDVLRIFRELAECTLERKRQRWRRLTGFRQECGFKPQSEARLSDQQNLGKRYSGGGGRNRPFFAAFAHQIRLILLGFQAKTVLSEPIVFNPFWCPLNQCK